MYLSTICVWNEGEHEQRGVSVQFFVDEEWVGGEVKEKEEELTGKEGEREGGKGRLTAEETTFRKLVAMVAATARARRVFPVPGGP